MVVAILGAAFVLTLPDRARGFFAAGSFFKADGDGALMARGSLVLGFVAVDLVERGCTEDAGKSNPGIILSTSSSVSSSASSASIGCSVGISAGREALLEAAGDSTAGNASSATLSSRSIVEGASAGVASSSTASTASMSSSTDATGSSCGSGLSMTGSSIVAAWVGAASASANCRLVTRTGFASGVVGRALEFGCSGIGSLRTTFAVSAEIDGFLEVSNRDDASDWSIPVSILSSLEESRWAGL